MGVPTDRKPAGEEQVREAGDSETQISLRAVGPGIRQRFPTAASDRSSGGPGGWRSPPRVASRAELAAVLLDSITP